MFDCDVVVVVVVGVVVVEVTVEVDPELVAAAPLAAVAPVEWSGLPLSPSPVQCEPGPLPAGEPSPLWELVPAPAGEVWLALEGEL